MTSIGNANFHFDSINYQILYILHEDARVPASSIAKQLDLNVRTVNKRINRMLDSGAVRTPVVINKSCGHPTQPTLCVLQRDQL